MASMAGASRGLPTREFGGAGAHIDELAEATFELSRQCAATGMVFAMHQIQVACIVRHADRVMAPAQGADPESADPEVNG